MTQDPQRPNPPDRPEYPDEKQRLANEERRLQVVRQNLIVRRIINFDYYLVIALEILLALRWLMRLFGANEENQIARFIYALSRPFVTPFTNLFPEPILTLEINTLVAMGVYALLAWLVGQFIWLVWGNEV
jgi:YggT family protein